MKKSNEILNQFWGFNSFRPLQEEIIDSIIYGHDTLAILPTGGGKSICFQVPGIALEGLTLVISPLIALIEDQVLNLQKRGINAASLTGHMSYREIDNTLDNARFGKMKFLYTSPERLKNRLFIERFKRMKIGLIVIDEAHCISEWGHDFRPAYRDISELRKYHPNVPLAAFTASATERVRKDIILQLDLKKPELFTADLSRENLSYQVIPSDNKLNRVIEFCKEHSNQTGIIYCQTRRSVKFVVNQLRALNLSAGIYHGGLKADDRKYMLEQWMNGSIKIMVATNAFGMGIDKADVRFVLHYEIPNNLEAYYQEAGRAGRNGENAEAIAFWEQADLDKMDEQLTIRYPSLDRIKLIYNSVCNYLKVAIGSGLSESYDFEIQKFSKGFKIPVSETYYAIKILELNGNLNFSENNYLSTRIKIAVGNSTLYKFQVSNDRISPLIVLLTRSYPGIFDRYININEAEISKLLKISRSELIKQLEYTVQYGVTDVNFQTNIPKLTFIQARLTASNLTISSEVYFNRKKVEQEKLNAILGYITKSNCRSKTISEYFSNSGKSCGICDFCLDKENSTYSFQELTELIPKELPSTALQLSKKLNTTLDITARALHHLILEEKICLVEHKYQLI